MAIIKLSGRCAAVALSVIIPEISAGDAQNGEVVIKISNHFYKESGAYRPLSGGLLFDRCSVISVNDKNEYRFIKCSASNDNFRVFNAPERNTNVWASGAIGGVGTGLPFIWMSKRIDSNFLSVSYFYAWQINLNISGIEDKYANDLYGTILLPKPADEIKSFLFHHSTIDLGGASFTVIPGNYLLLVIKYEALADPIRFSVVEQKGIELVHPTPSSLDDVFFKINFVDLKAQSYSMSEIVKSTPWLLVPNDCGEAESVVLEINNESVRAFDACK
jgi:hypothetical protein